jgi:mono/diheme cytochrome c family protein
MHTRNVRNTAVGFALALVAVALWSASQRGGREAAPPVVGGDFDGRALFERHCAKCHAADEFASELRGPESGAAVLQMLEFLTDHGAASELEDRAIVGFMSSVGG